MPAQNLCLNGISLCLRDGQEERPVLHIPQLTLPAGAVAGISGVSGSGKTTLLRLISGLSLPTTGSVHWGEQRIDTLPEQQRDCWRGTAVGFVFQDFRLFPTLSVLENVLLPVTFYHRSIPPQWLDRAQSLLLELGMKQWKQRAHSLSRGEQQRVAVARALLLRPQLLLADEPTASLDVENARTVMDALLAYAHAEQATLCVVSHDRAALNRLSCRLHLERGRLVSEPA